LSYIEEGFMSYDFILFDWFFIQDELK